MTPTVSENCDVAVAGNDDSHVKADSADVDNDDDEADCVRKL